MNKKLRSTLTLPAIITFFAAFIWIKQHNYISLDQLNMHKHFLMNFVDEHYQLSAIIFIISYILFAALLLPGAGILSLAGGLLFGVLWGSIYVTIGATIGAFFAFLMTRYFIGAGVQQKYGKALTKFNDAVTHYGPIYFFIVRLIPFFPFFLVNMLAGLTQISSKTFLITTALGVLPLVFGFTFLGAQLRHTDTIEDFFTYPLAVAGILLLISIALHMITKRLHRD
jgi:uncharacterized membrane protein YdjX (TVP38/TMEM64 family)